MKLETIKESIESLWDSVTEGWQHLRQTASNALTHFKPNESSQLPKADEVDDPLFMPVRSWSMLGGEVFEDDARLVVRLEVPGLEKQDMEIEVRDDALILKGEKRFERESTQGRWKVMQCAYGSFHRVVPISVPVVTDKATASYKNGVLRVELPKASLSKPAVRSIKVE